MILKPNKMSRKFRIWQKQQLMLITMRLLTSPFLIRIDPLVPLKCLPLWVRGSRIGPTCPPACHKRRLHVGSIGIHISQTKSEVLFYVLFIYSTFIDALYLFYSLGFYTVYLF